MTTLSPWVDTFLPLLLPFTLGLFLLQPRGTPLSLWILCKTSERKPQTPPRAANHARGGKCKRRKAKPLPESRKDAECG